MPTKINIKDKVNENVCDLSLSELEEIPIKEIAALKRITILDLSLNRLVTLGKNFCILNRLVKLDLSKNRLKCLPDNFGLLQQLRYLDLFGNQLEHLPLSFGDLQNLRYLDLHNNPLNAALAKITGPCLTNRDCQESAKRTVNFMSLMQTEVIKVKRQYMQVMLLQNQSANQNDNKDLSCSHHDQSPSTMIYSNTMNSVINNIKTFDNGEQMVNQKNIKKSNRKTKSKKKSIYDGFNNQLQQQQQQQHQLGASASSGSIIMKTSNKLKRQTINVNQKQQQKSFMNHNKIKNNHNINNKNNNKNNNDHNDDNDNNDDNDVNDDNDITSNHSAALSSLITFLLLLIVNIVLIYMIMFKNPQIAEKLIDAIPYQYRNWILSKTEIFRLRVTDWISEFRTPPEEH